MLFLTDPIFDEEDFPLLAPSVGFFHCYHFISRFVALFLPVSFYISSCVFERKKKLIKEIHTERRKGTLMGSVE
jgi:hypothetical protein